MKQTTKFICEKCELKFENEEECLDHEIQCSLTESFTCDKCGKTKEWDKNSDWAFSYAEECHYISLGRMGYGSGLDGCDVNFQICDDCLIEFINSFTLEGQEKVLNSGSNYHMSPEDWIREAKGEFTDEEYEAYGMYSPRQRKAYYEQYPVCDKVSIVEYKDGSRGSHCTRMAFGNKDGSAEGHQPSTECYECKSFKRREEGKEIPVTYDKFY